MSASQDQDITERAYAWCLKLLTARRRTACEITAKLRSKKYVDEIIAQVLSRLRAQNLIDDEAYARDYVRTQQAHQLFGRYRLHRALGRKGIAPEQIERVLATGTDDDERQRARTSAERKLMRDRALYKGTDRMTTMHEQKRVFEYLVRRGFSRAIAMDTLQHLKHTLP